MRRDNARRQKVFAAILLLLCGGLFARSSGCDNAQPDPELQPFESCEQLETWVADAAVELYTFDPARAPEYPTPLLMLLGCSDASGDSGGYSSGTGASSYSTTNIQEIGVDEADFVKNDGEYLYVVHGQDLAIIDAWPAEDLREIARLELEGYPLASYLDGDAVAVLSLVEGGLAPEEGSAELGDETLKVTLVDVADRLDPVVVREVYLEGRLLDSRRIDNRLYLVTYRDLSVLDQPVTGTDEQKQQALRARSAEDWVPGLVINTRDGQGWSLEQGQSCGCTDIYYPARPAGLGLTTVVTVDLSNLRGEVAGTAVIAGEGEVYASLESLYLAVTEPSAGPWRIGAESQGTRIHRFDLDPAAARPTYAASGRVPGAIVNQFAMDEAEDTFRIATTRWLAPSRDRINGLYVMREADGVLETLSSVDDIAQGEEIYSARFFDEMVYLVTFPVGVADAWDGSVPEREMTDPLFAIDLSDPEAPVVLGELEVTGYSRYLHPLGDDHLLAVGEEVDPNNGVVLGLQVSLFDISDPAAPQLQDRYNYDTWWSTSEALIDHHAFTYYEPLDMLAIPLVIGTGESEWDDLAIERVGLAVFEVTADEGITVVGEIDATALMNPDIAADYLAYCSQVRRSVVIGDMLYGVAAGGVIAAPVEDPSTPTAVLEFPHHGYCDQPWVAGNIVW